MMEKQPKQNKLKHTLYGFFREISVPIILGIFFLILVTIFKLVTHT